MIKRNIIFKLLSMATSMSNIARLPRKEILDKFNQMTWTVYILQCSDNTLYTGITNDLSRRLAQHNAGQGAKYTKGRAPLKLVYSEVCSDKSHALQRELQIKALKRAEKMVLIGEDPYLL